MFQTSALSLLADYGGDSSDEEIPGPKVSTKRSYIEDDTSHYSRKYQRLPVPEQFTHRTEVDHVDNPLSHDGRIRSFAHERGNWATFVYIPFEANPGLLELLSFINHIVPDQLNLKMCDNFHISLTKTVILKYHWIESFVETLKENLRCFQRFVILFDSLKIYCNEERTRTFLGIQIRSGRDTLLKLVETLDESLGEYNLCPFYKDPSFHMSVAWTVGDMQEELQLYLSRINNKFEELLNSLPQENWYILVENILCKIGNKHFQFAIN